MASSMVTCELGSHGQPFEPQKSLLFDEKGDGLRCERLRDKKLDTLFTHLSICAQVGLPCVGVDRHPGVATSTDGIQVVERNRPLSIAQVAFCAVCNEKLHLLIFYLASGPTDRYSVLQTPRTGAIVREQVGLHLKYRCLADRIRCFSAHAFGPS